MSNFSEVAMQEWEMRDSYYERNFDPYHEPDDDDGRDIAFDPDDIPEGIDE